MGKLPFEKRKPKVLVKREAETNWDYGCKPEDRGVEELVRFGIVNVNKLSGPSSHEVSSFVKKILKVNKAGHSGTLDPGVTGVLPVATEKATRIVQTLLKAGKEYICLMHLHKDVSEEEIRETCGSFVGKIRQLPPVKSAVKRQEREREIYYLDILEIKGKDVLFKVGCEAGTYIRKLVHDVGEELDCGAHMAELIRTKAGPFNYHDWVSLYELKDAYEAKDEKEIRRIVGVVEKGVEHLKKIWILDGAVDTLCHGANLGVPGVSKLDDDISRGDLVAVLTLKGELVCLGEAFMDSRSIMDKSRGLCVNVKKVFMDRKVYLKYS